MKRVKLIIAYDGTNYCGWQIQINGITVEEVLNKAISELTGVETAVIGASRTDSGVHAMGNVAVFDTESKIPGEKFSFALNQRLPNDIRIQKSEEVPLEWHPRFCNSTEAAKYIVGEHDFASFCSSGSQVESTVRTVYRLEVDKNDDVISIIISGNGFLYNMVRIIVGTLIKVGLGVYPPEYVKEIIEAKDRNAAGPKAPACGLMQVKIDYED